MDKILVGADPEVFVRDNKGRLRSAYGLIPGDKKDPFPVVDGAVQVDGMALEFNITPAVTPKEFQEKIQKVMRQMEAMVPPIYTIEVIPTADFHPLHMRAQPEEATQLGCEPDYNAYTLAENVKPDGKVNFRTGSGHVHIGFCDGADPRSEEHMQRCATLVRHLDVYLGLPSLLWDRDNKRRLLYGKAGAFRPKSYGCEYRTLSNAWLKDPKLMQYIFNQVQRAVSSLKRGERFTEAQHTQIKRFIDQGITPSRWTLESYNIQMPPVVA